MDLSFLWFMVAIEFIGNRRIGAVFADKADIGRAIIIAIHDSGIRHLLTAEMPVSPDYVRRVMVSKMHSRSKLLP